MLVGPFKVQVGRPALFGPMATLECEDMGAAAVEPDVENVGLPLIIGGVVGVSEKFLRPLVSPGVAGAGAGLGSGELFGLFGRPR